MRTLLHSVAKTITNPAAAGRSAEETSPGARPIPETGMP
jgi:hypothetical protein